MIKQLQEYTSCDEISHEKENNIFNNGKKRKIWEIIWYFSPKDSIKLLRKDLFKQILNF